MKKILIIIGALLIGFTSYGQTKTNALVPVKGLLLWNDTDGVLQVYSGTAWKTIMTNL